MRYAHLGTFLPLKIVMVSYRQYLSPMMNLRHYHYLIHLILSRPFIFFFRRVLPFIFLETVLMKPSQLG